MLEYPVCYQKVVDAWHPTCTATFSSTLPEKNSIGTENCGPDGRKSLVWCHPVWATEFSVLPYNACDVLAVACSSYANERKVFRGP
jgi:hypothetical protein